MSDDAQYLVRPLPTRFRVEVAKVQRPAVVSTTTDNPREHVIPGTRGLRVLGNVGPRNA